jgi:hypothetical protein
METFTALAKKIFPCTFSAIQVKFLSSENVQKHGLILDHNDVISTA